MAESDSLAPKEKRVVKRLLLINASVLGSAAALCIIAYVLLIHGVGVFGEREFRSRLGPTMHYYKSIADTQWVSFFGGRAGLPRLERLASDPGISPIGQKKAAFLVGYIQSGKHIEEMEMELSACG